MILATILGVSLLGQVALPGENMSVDEAWAKSRIVLIAAPWNEFSIGDNSGRRGRLGLGQLEILKGEPKDPSLVTVNVCPSGKEKMPKQRERYVFFLIEGKPNFAVLAPELPTAIKVVPSSPEILAKLKSKSKKDTP